MNQSSNTLYNAALVAALAALTGLLVYGAHAGGLTSWFDMNSRISGSELMSGANTGYEYPFHHDEWVHLNQATFIMRGGGLEFVAPQYKGKPYYTDYETGFDLFLAAFFGFTGLDPVLGYKYLPAAFASMGALCVFFLTRHVSGSFLAGLFSMLFFASLRSDINLLGLWFFVPYVMAIPMVYASTLFFLKGLHDDSRYFAPFFLVVAAELAVYAAFAFLSLIVFGAYLLAHMRSTRRGGWVVGVFVALAATGVIGFHFLADDSIGGGFGGTVRHIAGKLTFHASEEKAGDIFVSYDPVTTYGVLPSVLAFIGLYAVSMRVYERGRAAILIPWLFLALLSLLSVKLFDVTYFARHVRIVYFGMLALVPLSAIGLNMVAESVANRVSSLMPRRGSMASKASVLALSGLVFSAVFSGYYSVPEYRFPYHAIERQDYEAIRWVGERMGSGRVVLASAGVSEAVYAVSGNYVVERNGISDRRPVFVEFMGGDCAGGRRIIEENEVDLVVSRWPLECPEYLAKVYDRGDYVYEVNRGQHQELTR